MAGTEDTANHPDYWIREEHQLLEETGRVAGVGGWMLDLSDHSLRWTSQTRRIHEVPDHFLPTVSEAISFYDPSAQPLIREAVERCQKDGTPWDLELPFLTASGRKLWVRAIGQAEFRDGKAIRLFGTFQDITDRIMAEQAATSQNRILEAIASDQPLTEVLESVCVSAEECLTGKMVSILLLDDDGMHDLRGANAEAQQVIVDRDLNPGRREFADFRNSDIMTDGRMSTPDMTGDPRWTAFIRPALNYGFRSCWSTPIRSSGGGLLGALAIYGPTPFEPSPNQLPIIDQATHLARIAISKSIEDSKLRRSEQLLREALVRAKLGYWLLDLATGNLELSPEACALLERDRSYQPNLSDVFREIIHPDDVAALEQEKQRTLDHPGATGQIDLRCRMPDGRIRWMVVEGIATADPSGRPLTLTGTVQDITDRRIAADERTELQAQLWQSQKLESIGRLAGGVAHDFNNMLAVILGHAEIAMLNENPDSRMHEHLSAIQLAGKRSAELSRQLLAFARRQTAAPQVLDLNASIAAMLQMLRRLIGENIELIWRPGHNLEAIHIDPIQVDQIVANLVVNARDAIPDSGQITIRTAIAQVPESRLLRHNRVDAGSYVTLSIADNGCGMDSDVLERLFEPFFTTKSVGKGTGLGLATVFGIVQQNHGAVDVRSVPGQGTTFVIYLPISHENVPTTQLPTTWRPGSSNGERILLVEDEPALLTVCRNHLRQLGYDVLTASRPSEAIQIFQNEHESIALLMTDVVMPEMSGWDLATRLKSIRPELKCLFMSGYNDETVSDRGIVQSSVTFLHKPFDIRQLSIAVRRAIRPVRRSSAG